MIEIAVPEFNLKNKEKTTKDLVFSILVEESPKTLTQLHREIKKRYGISVSFQAVIKAINSLLSHDIIIKEARLYSLNKDWIFETRNFFDKIYSEQFKVNRPMKKIELGKDVTIYTVHNLLELDKLWNDLLTNWAKHEAKDKRNVWKGRHCWWLIPRLQEEDILHDFLLKQNIKTYNLVFNKTLLDKLSLRYYANKGEYIKSIKKDKSLNVDLSAFGEYILKCEIPQDIYNKLEKIYQKTKKIQDLNLKEVLDIFKENSEIEVTLIKDKFLADKIKEDIIKKF